MNERDREDLQELKKAIVDSCTKCKGNNLQCSCYKKFMIEARKITAGIPKRYRNFKLSDLDSPGLASAVLQVDNYIKNIVDNYKNGIGLYLVGKAGSGKTALESITLSGAIEKGYNSHFTKVETLISKYLDNDLEDILTIDFLGIDDLGKEMHTQASSKLLGTALDIIIRNRGSNMLPTIITSNQTYHDIEIIYGEFGNGLVSLFSEQLLCITCNLTGVDYRKEVIRHKNKRRKKE